MGRVTYMRQQAPKRRLRNQPYLTEKQWRMIRMDERAPITDIIEHRDIDGHLHGQPAKIFPSGKALYYHHGVLHREDGPAIVSPYADPQYWYMGRLVPTDLVERLGMDGAIMRLVVDGRW